MAHHLNPKALLSATWLTLPGIMECFTASMYQTMYRLCVLRIKPFGTISLLTVCQAELLEQINALCWGRKPVDLGGNSELYCRPNTQRLTWHNSKLWPHNWTRDRGWKIAPIKFIKFEWQIDSWHEGCLRTSYWEYEARLSEEGRQGFQCLPAVQNQLLDLCLSPFTQTFACKAILKAIAVWALKTSR